MSEQNKKYDSRKAVQELAKRGVSAPVCPFCRGNQFSIAGEFAAVNVSTEMGSVDLRTHIPSAVLICERCGNLQFFALAKLGMMDNRGSNDR